MEGIQTLKGSWPWPWPSIRPYGISSCSSHRPLPIYQLSFNLKKLFVDGRTYGRTDVRTDGRTGGRTFFPSILLGRLSEVDPNMFIRFNKVHERDRWTDTAWRHRPRLDSIARQKWHLKRAKELRDPVWRGLWFICKARLNWTAIHLVIISLSFSNSWTC